MKTDSYVVHSSTVGEAAWSPAVDINQGAAGVYCPPDTGMPEDGVVIKGDAESAKWIFADIDLSLITRLRKWGQVLNYKNWSEQIDKLKHF